MYYICRVKKTSLIPENMIPYSINNENQVLQASSFVEGLQHPESAFSRYFTEIVFTIFNYNPFKGRTIVVL